MDDYNSRTDRAEGRICEPEDRLRGKTNEVWKDKIVNYTISAREKLL